MKIIIKEVEKSYGSKKVLDKVNYTFEKGKIYGLLGLNGVGKTTLFDCMSENISTDSGKFLIEENDISRKLLVDDIGYILSTPVVPDFLTAREFLKFFIDINKKKIVIDKTVDDYFDMMLIKKEDQDKLLKDYSHGMKNKIQMLINFITSPSVLLMDEPLTSFDVVVADEMKNILRDIKSNHVIILSTHIMELAIDLCDEIVILNNGKLLEINSDNLDDEQFKSKIIETLKENSND